MGLLASGRPNIMRLRLVVMVEGSSPDGIVSNTCCGFENNDSDSLETMNGAPSINEQSSEDQAPTNNTRAYKRVNGRRFSRHQPPGWCPPATLKAMVDTNVGQQSSEGLPLTELLPYEVRWRDKQPLLASRGYNLRPRYHLGWRPSWIEHPESSPFGFEDFWQLPVSYVSLSLRSYLPPFQVFSNHHRRHTTIRRAIGLCEESA